MDGLQWIIGYAVLKGDLRDDDPLLTRIAQTASDLSLQRKLNISFLAVLLWFEKFVLKGSLFCLVVVSVLFIGHRH